MNDISDPQNFIMADILTKNSKSGFTSNKRLLVIKRGHLYYYSNVPKEYKNDVTILENLKQIPKCSIQISNIRKINGSQGKANSFSLQFQAKHMMQKQDIRKTMTLQQFNFAPKNKKQSITWEFSCDNATVKQKWVSNIQQLKKHFNKQKVNIDKFFQNIKSQQQKSNYSAVRNSSIPWKEDQMKKNGSNQSLRRSQMNQSYQSGKLSGSRSPSPNSKKSINSQDKVSPKSLKKSESLSSEQLVQSFIKLQKTRSANQFSTSPVIQQQHQQLERNSQEFKSPNNIQPAQTVKTKIQQVKIPEVEVDQQKSQQDIDQTLSKNKIFRKQTIEIQNMERPVTPEKKQIKNEVHIHETITQYSKESQLVSEEVINNKQFQKQMSFTNMFNIHSQPSLYHPWSQPKLEHQPEPNQVQKEPQPQLQEKMHFENQSEAWPQNQPETNQEINYSQMSNPPESRQQIQEQRQEYKQLQNQFNYQPQLNNQILGGSKQLNLTRQINLFQITKKRRVNQPKKTLYSMKNNIEFKVDDNTNIYELLYFACNRQYPFDKRIETQKKINAKIGSFTDKSLKSFTQFVNSKKGSVEGSKSRFSQQKINDNLSILQIGYTKFKIGYVNTQTVLINGKKKQFYNEGPIKQLKREMKIYNELFQDVSQQIKNLHTSKSLDLQNSLQMSLNKSIQIQNEYSSLKDALLYEPTYPVNMNYFLTQLRVPLCTYFQYKGVCAIAYDETHHNQQQQITDRQLLNQWKQIIRKLGYNSNYFKFATINTTVQPFIIVYITSASKNIYLNYKQKKHHNVTFQSPMNVQFLRRAKREGASTSTQSLLRYIKAIRQIKDTSSFVTPKSQILTTLQYCYLCKHLRKFYRAAHAQIDEVNFINILLKGDLTSMFESSGFEFQPLKTDKTQILGIFFQFILYYLGIKCQVNIQKFHKYASLVPLGINKKQSRESQIKFIKSVKIFPRVIGFNLSNFQLYESFNKLDHYIAYKSKQLAYKSLQLKQSTYFENQFQSISYPWPAFTKCLYNSAQLNYMENDFISSINKSKEFLSLISPLPNQEQGRWFHPAPSCCIPVYFLMMKCYSTFSKEKFNEILKETLESTFYNFGQQSSMTITLFSFSALIFCSHGQYSQAENFLTVAIKIAKKIYNQHKKLKLSDLYIDLQKVLLHQNKALQAKQLLINAQKIVEKQGSYDQKISFEIENLQIALKQPKDIQNQQNALQKIHKIEKMLKRAETKFYLLKRYYHLSYQVGAKYDNMKLREKAIEQLWKLDLNSKILAVQGAFKIIIKEIEWNIVQYQSIIQKRMITKQKSILKIDQNLKNYKNLLQMMRQVFKDGDEELISAFLKLLPAGIIRAN